MINKKVVLAFSLCVAAIIFFIFATPSEELVSSADMYLTVGNQVGLNADNDSINFGIIPPSGIGTRPINIAAGESGKFIIKLEGELASWVYVSDNNFKLARGENNTITVQATVPKDAEYRDYTGRLDVFIRKI